MQIFGVALEQVPRLMAAWDAWFEFLGLVISGNSHSDKLLAHARQQHPELTRGNEPELWMEFAKVYAGLPQRQAEAMYWKDWFWTVRECDVVYADEQH